MSPAGQPILAGFEAGRPFASDPARRRRTCRYWTEYRSTGLQTLLAFVRVGSATARTYHCPRWEKRHVVLARPVESATTSRFAAETHVEPTRRQNWNVALAGARVGPIGRTVAVKVTCDPTLTLVTWPGLVGRSRTICRTTTRTAGLVAGPRSVSPA